MVGERFHFPPGTGVVDMNLLVVRSSGEQWLGRVEGDGRDGTGMVGKGFDFFPSAGVVDVNPRAARSNDEQWVGRVEDYAVDKIVEMIGDGFD